MRPYTFLLPTILAAISIIPKAFSADATPAVNNPPGAGYRAILPTQKSQISGQISISSAPDGRGANVQVMVKNLPSVGGPFTYHVHENPVPADGNCTGTGAHLDPFGRGETPPCDASDKASCQVGDLAEKWGKLTQEQSSYNYVDPFLSLIPGTSEFIGNRSIVVHYANKTRITCADLVHVGGNSTAGSNATTANNASMSLTLAVPPGIASTTGVSFTMPGSSAASTASATTMGSSTNGAVAKMAYGVGAGVFGLAAFLL